MIMNNWIGYIATLLGLILVVAGWLIWGDRTNTDIFALNIAVSVVAYCVMFVDVLIPWADLRDKTQRRIGNTGVRWFVQYGYSITAILLLVLCNLLGLTFIVSLFLQCVVLTLLIFGIATAKTTAAKISEVSQENSDNINYLTLVREGVSSLLEATHDAQAPQLLIARIERQAEELRYVSPSNSAESRKVENELMELLAATETLMRNYEVNNERIEANIAKAERLIKKRKSTFSN